MGMHTRLSFTAILKPEFVEMLQKLHGLRMNHANPWQLIADEYGFSWFHKWARFRRAALIPFGGRVDEIATHERNGRVWTVRCWLKNYDRIIEHFLENVFSVLVESVEACEVEYEEWECPQPWKLIDGKMAAQYALLWG